MTSPEVTEVQKNKAAALNKVKPSGKTSFNKIQIGREADLKVEIEVRSNLNNDPDYYSQESAGRPVPDGLGASTGEGRADGHDRPPPSLEARAVRDGAERSGSGPRARPRPRPRGADKGEGMSP